MDFPFRLPTLVEYSSYIILIWLGFGTLIGLLARIVFPGREPSGPLGTILIGIMGSVVGPLVVETTCGIKGFHPISPLGFVAAFGGAAVILVTYRFFLLVLADHLPTSQETPDEEVLPNHAPYPPPSDYYP